MRSARKANSLCDHGGGVSVCDFPAHLTGEEDEVPAPQLAIERCTQVSHLTNFATTGMRSSGAHTDNSYVPVVIAEIEAFNFLALEAPLVEYAELFEVELAAAISVRFVP